MTLAALATALAFGLRHGFDWDHIAAIGDITSSTKDRRRGLMLSTLYALGHAAVVFALGATLILAGFTLPDWLNDRMGPVVGITLMALGAWVIFGVARHGEDFKLRSRWQIVATGVHRGLKKIRRTPAGRTLATDHVHDHEHAGDDSHDHSSVPAVVEFQAEPVGVVDSTSAPGAGSVGGVDRPVPATHRHRHSHTHELVLGDEPLASYGRVGATGIGVLHGVGVESPTQIAAFVAATSVSGRTTGLALLGAWVAGLVLANTAIAVGSLLGQDRLMANPRAQVAIAVAVGLLSFAFGASMVLAG